MKTSFLFQEVLLNGLVFRGAEPQKTPLASSQALWNRVSTMTAQTPCECTGIKSLSPTMENIHIYPEKSQLTVHNSSPSFWKVVGAELHAVETSRPGGVFWAGLSPGQRCLHPFAEEIYLETLSNHQGLLLTVCLEVMGTSSCAFLLGMSGLSNSSLFSEF